MPKIDGIEDVKNRLEENYPKGIDLVYVDYRDAIEDSATLEELATTGYVDDSFVTDWCCDAGYETINWVIDDIFDEEEALIVSNTEELYDFVRDWCYEHDTSDPIRDLLRHTGMQWFFYDLNYYAEGDDYIEEAENIAKHLGIDYEKNKKELHELTNNAFYGGRLVVLFGANPLDLLSMGKESKYIRFTDYKLAIMDRVQGSGWLVDMTEPLDLVFYRSMLHHDDGCAGYSLSGDVCGLGREESGWTFSNSIMARAIDCGSNEKLKEYSDREKELDRVFKEGGCTYGDTDMRRHKDTPYINEFPCGWKCLDCGQFWID